MILLNDRYINITRFPDNTTQVWQLDNEQLESKKNFDITWEFTQEGEFIQIAQLKMLLNSYGPSNLYIKYLPYGRQDKDVSNNTTFALHTFATLINSLEFIKVTILDPHSEVALKLINNSEAIYPKNEIKTIISLTNSSIVCYPDKGAVSKYTKIYDYPYIFGEKVRDQLTGNIISYEIFGDALHNDFYGKNIIIIDDICDGGATFKLLADKLLKAGAREVNLFITHGIFSKGLKTIKESGINRIFTSKGEASENKEQILYKTI